MGHGTIAVTSIRNRKHFQSVKFATVFLSLEGKYHLFNKVIDIQHFEFNRRVIDRNRKVICNIVAESRYGAVIVRPAPFAVQVRETVYQYLHPVLLSILQKQVFPCLFAASVLTVAETSCKGSLGAAGKHHGSLVAVLFQSVKQGIGKPEIAFHEFFRILGSVDPGEVEHEVAFPAPFFQLSRCRIQIVFIHLVDLKIAITAGFSFSDIVELGTQVPAYEALSSCNKYFHCPDGSDDYFAIFSIPFSSF